MSFFIEIGIGSMHVLKNVLVLFPLVLKHEGGYAFLKRLILECICKSFFMPSYALKCVKVNLIY